MESSSDPSSTAAHVILDAVRQGEQRFKHVQSNSPSPPSSSLIDPELETYGYEPLQARSHTRLLRLQSGEGDDSVRCSLFEADTDAAHSYEAISYAWGDPKDRIDIYCDSRRISITRSLFDALWYFRLPDRPRTL
jgi:hypothetical protein